ncbi:MAG: VWA domain-containing protein [Candidatus Magnetoovum sp. WYHC-5]|nr:VWA domain-containing protein [Candidatus Magnetoovum sp. WYHC-5]
MRFADIQMWNFLWLVLIVLILYIYSLKQRQRLLTRLAEVHLLNSLVTNWSKNRIYVKYLLILLCILFSTLALMRPQWGVHLEEVKRRGLDILIAVDSSKSMLASDVKPNRLERAKLAIKDLVERLNGDRVGLIGFAGRAFLFCPLTVDYNGFVLALNDLSVESIPVAGTSITSAVDEAIKLYSNSKLREKILILITDGEDHVGSAIEAAKKAMDKGINIYTVGIGTKDGELIKIIDKDGNTYFLKDKDGNVVISRLDEDTLKKMAEVSGGVYISARGADFGLDSIYQTKLSQMEKKELDTKMERLYDERFQVPLVLAVLFLLVDTLMSEAFKKRGNGRWLKN